MYDAFYMPTLEQLKRLSGPWSCAYSGGKDSTSLVTWIEWLRRSGHLRVPRPQLVRSDTGVEDPKLFEVIAEMESLLRQGGWECACVVPKVKDKLFVMIFGRGVTPIHPGVRRMRWCTRSTKIDPMDQWRADNATGLCLTGVRLGESEIRDGKIKKSFCAAGGECGLPEVNERTYSPILRWTTCQVIDWLNGNVDRAVRDLMRDVLAVTAKLAAVYGFRIGQPTFAEFGEPEIKAARFGCIGCPAIQAKRNAPQSMVSRHGADSPLCELYNVWFEARLRANRCFRIRIWNGRPTAGYGPIKMNVRKRLFERVLDIQARAGVILVTPEDEVFIRRCWADMVYPNGWGPEDELTIPPSDSPLFDGQQGE